MGDILIYSLSALWLGILTSISPCPLATNIAAISYVGKKVNKTRHVFYSGVLYTLGRTFAYLVIGIILVTSLLKAPYVSGMLQIYMNKLLGPILIVVGMFLLELISVNFSGKGVSSGLENKIEKMGLLGAFFLGVLFALSFCPVSAALFFGSLLSIAIKADSAIIIPSIYGIGTGLPVMLFAIVIAAGAKHLATIFDKCTAYEKWARKITGGIFILVGFYYTLSQIFGII